MLKKIIRRYFYNFAYFYRYLRYKIFIAIGLSIAVGALDAIGLSMFLPILQTVNGSEGIDPAILGNLRFIIDGIEALGVNLTLGFVLLFMLFFFILKGIAKYISRVYRIVLQQYFVRTLRFTMLSSLNRMSYKKFAVSDVGRIQNTMSGEVDRVVLAYTNYFGAFEQGILVLVYMVFAFFVDAKFAVLVTFGGLTTNFLYKVLYKHTKGASKKLTVSSNVYQGEVIQYVANFKYLRATGLSEVFSGKMRKTIHDIEYSRRKIGILASLLEAAREPILIAVVVVVIIVQVELLNGALAGILLSLLFFYRALTALTALQNQWNGFLSVTGSLDNVQAFQKELNVNKEETGKTKIEGFKKTLSAKNLCFSYGQQPILKNINLEISKGQTVAFVGESGSGKTTLVNMLVGLLPPDDGDIYMDGNSIRELDRQTYQRRIGYITQEPIIFSDTIFNNITFWAAPTEENKAKFYKVLKNAFIYDFVEQLPEKENALLGNNGINLSGGQKQRISIARELYKDIDILILDEATSALDSETEKEIQNNIDELKGSYTILIIAHRLSTIRNADVVYLMDKGQIIGQGSFTQLIEGSERFRRMVELQEV